MATDRTERLLNLVICLLGASRPVSRSALRDSIPGYAEAKSDDAFERMFERDKDELRTMGIPIDTVLNAQGEVEGYLIDEDDYAMPAVTLDAAELSVIGVASRLWTEAALLAQAGSALRKLEAITGERLEPPDLLAGRSAQGEEHLPTIWEALRMRRAVRFEYLARGRDSAEQRVVEPWATVHRDGAWYLVGLSRERSDGRAFRLSRIAGPINQLRDEVPAPTKAELEMAVAAIAEPPAKGTARVTLPSRGGARLRDAARSLGDGTWEIDYVDIHYLISQANESGAIILAPQDAVEGQLAALGRVLAAHGVTDA